MRACTCFLLASIILQYSEVFILKAEAQKLTGNLTGSGASCIPDAFSAGTGLGVGCGEDEACCPTTNTCVKRNSCAEFAKICPPPTCGKDTNFFDTECPAQVSKMFKSPKGLKCQSSSDAACYTNGTAMVVTCTNDAKAPTTRLIVLVLATIVSVVMLWY